MGVGWSFSVTAMNFRSIAVVLLLLYILYIRVNKEEKWVSRRSVVDFFAINFLRHDDSSIYKEAAEEK